MNRNLLLVAISLFTWGLGEGFFIYFQPLYLQEWGADPVMIGSILGAVGMILALVQIPAGILSDRFGPRMLMWASWILGALAAWMMTLAHSLPVFVIGLLVYGLTGFGVIPMNVYITNVRGKLSVGRALTFVSGMYSLGAVIGPVIGGTIADRLGLRMVYLFAACIFMVSTLIILFAQQVKEIHPADHREIKASSNILRNPRFLAFVGITFITMLVLYLPQPFTPSFLQNQQHLSRTTIGLLGAFGSLGNAVAMLVLGNISPFIGLLIGQIWVALFAALFIWGNSPFWFGMGYFFFGGYRLCRAMVLAYARPMAHPGQTGLLFGTLETASAVAVIVAPILAGFLYANNPVSIYQFALIAIVVTLLLNVFFLRKLTREPVQELKKDEE